MRNCHPIAVILTVAVMCIELGQQPLWAEGPHVAIVAAATNSPITNERFTDLRDVLVDDGRFSAVDIISTTQFGTGTPSLSELLEYDAIIHWSNDSNDDAVALGNVFADYVDTGHGLVQAVFANTSSNPNRFLQGRWLTGGYNIIPPNGGFVQGPTPSGASTETAVMNAPLEPDHPVFDGVGEVRLSTGIFSGGGFWGAYRPTLTALEPNARKLAVWEDGKTAVAISDLFPNRIDLGFHPVSDRVADGYYDLTSDADLLIANSLLFVAPKIVSGDFDGDGFYTCSDMNALSVAISGGGDVLTYDLTGDGILNTDDRDAWLVKAGEDTPKVTGGNPFLLTDFNLNSVVDGEDFIIWNAHKFTVNANYCDGDANADGFIDGQDFLIWNFHKFTSANAATQVPEPSPAVGLALVWLAALIFRREALRRVVNLGKAAIVISANPSSRRDEGKKMNAGSAWGNYPRSIAGPRAPHQRCRITRRGRLAKRGG